MSSVLLSHSCFLRAQRIVLSAVFRSLLFPDRQMLCSRAQSLLEKTGWFGETPAVLNFCSLHCSCSEFRNANGKHWQHLSCIWVGSWSQLALQMRMFLASCAPLLDSLRASGLELALNVMRISSTQLAHPLLHPLIRKLCCA